MLTGRPAFEGDDVSEILASVIKGSANLELAAGARAPGTASTSSRDALRRTSENGSATSATCAYELDEIQANPARDVDATRS